MDYMSLLAGIFLGIIVFAAVLIILLKKSESTEEIEELLKDVKPLDFDLKLKSETPELHPGDKFIGRAINLGPSSPIYEYEVIELSPSKEYAIFLSEGKRFWMKTTSLVIIEFIIRGSKTNEKD